MQNGTIVKYQDDEREYVIVGKVTSVPGAYWVEPAKPYNWQDESIMFPTTAHESIITAVKATR